MSLLTDEEIKDLTATWHVQHTTPQYRLVADASQTKTLKAVAEWLEDSCDTPSRLPHGGHHVKRKVCYACVLFLLEAIREGKMPGEE